MNELNDFLKKNSVSWEGVITIDDLNKFLEKMDTNNGLLVLPQIEPPDPLEERLKKLSKEAGLPEGEIFC